MQRLAAIAERLLRGAAPDELRDSCAALHELLTEVAGAETLDSADIALPSGLAIAPAAAAQCILDTNRTVAFVRGVWSAIGEMRHDPIEIVYAGTGPFAPLAIPLMALPEIRNVRFTLIDLHAQAVASVTKLVERFGLRASVRDIVCADAVTYRHPDPIHIAITETMQQALKTEPFVEIVRNLRGQLAPGGVLVPARVSISVATVDPISQQARWRDRSVQVTRGERTTIFEITAAGERDAPVTVNLQPGWVTLFTDIDVFGDIRLTEYDSGLTTPDILWPLSEGAGGEVTFHYARGSTPGIQWART